MQDSPRFPKTPKIEISETPIYLSKSEELRREKLGLELAQFLIQKNPKLSQIKELSGRFARKNRLKESEIKSILRYSLPHFLDEDFLELVYLVKNQEFGKNVKMRIFYCILEHYIINHWLKDVSNSYKLLTKIFRFCNCFELKILEIGFLLHELSANLQIIPINKIENYETDLFSLKNELFEGFETVIARILFD